MTRKMLDEWRTMEAIYLLRRLIKKYREKMDLHTIFIDLEKFIIALLGVGEKKV